MQSQHTKSIVLLYTNNKVTEKESRGIIPFTIAPRNIKYLEINLTEEVNDLHNKNYRTLKRRPKWTSKNEKISLIGRTTTVKIAIGPKVIKRVSAIPIKIPAATSPS